MSLVLPQAAMAGAAATVLAQQPGNGDGGGQGADFGKSSPVGLLVLVLFLIAVAFLVRSMTKHLRRIPTSFDPEEEAEEAKAAEEAEAGDADVAGEDAELDAGAEQREKTQPG